MGLKTGWQVGGLLALLACIGAAASLSSSTTSDDVYTDIDYDITTEVDLLKRENVSCPQPACVCRRSSAGQIVTATCNSFDWGNQTFQGVITALEVKNAPSSEGFFLASHSLASVGLKDVSAVRIVNSSLSVLNETTFAGLDQLEEVDLSDNKIPFPHRNVFRNTSNLEKLSLSGNPLGVFLFLLKDNEYLIDIPSLYELDISRCGINDLKPTTFSRLTQLQSLKLSGNMLESIHLKTFKDLPYLESVDFSDNNIIDFDGNLFESNHEINSLSLRNNSLISVPKLKTPSLEELDLSQNEIYFIGQSVLTHLVNLIQLNLSQNKISHIGPKPFENNKRLRKLDLSGNNISGALQKDIFAPLTVLEELILSDNPLMGSLPDTGFEGSFTVLNTLDVSYCELSQLTVNHFKNMEQLEHLKLKGNKLETVSPHVMAQLTKLRSLNLAKNKLRSLDSRLFQKNDYLQNLDLSENPLAVISSNMLPQSIKELDLGSCKLERLWAESTMPERLNKNLTRLTHLNVYGNELDEITIPELAILRDLSVFDLGNNPIDCSDASFYGVVEWLVKQVISPNYVKGKQIVIENSAEVAEENLRFRWIAVYDSMCGDKAYQTKMEEINKMIVPDVFPNLKEAYSYEDDQDSNEDDEDDEEDDVKGTADDEDDDDEDDEDEEGKEDDDSDTYFDGITKLRTRVSHGYPLLPTLLVSGSVFVMVLSLFMVVAAIRRRHERRSKPPMFRNLGSIPTGLRKDGGFVYKKLYEETTTPNVTPSAPFILRSSYSERV